MTLTRNDEATLVARIIEGDEVAFEELRRAYERSIYGFIRSHSDNDDDAQDIASDTWLKFLRKAKNYDPGRGGCLSFLRSIAWSTLVDFYRRKSQRAEILFSELEQHFAKAGDESDIGELLARLTPNAVRLAPEGMNRLLEELVLRITFAGSSPPHQLIVFGFVERLGWKPQDIVTDLSDRSLRLLEETLEREYISTSELSAEVVRRCFAPLRESMDRLLNEVLIEPKTRKVCQGFLTKLVGDTVLREYCTHNPAQEISHWCQAVHRRVLKETIKRSRSASKNNATPACDISPAQT